MNNKLTDYKKEEEEESMKTHGSTLVLILARSGRGKSSALRNCDPKHTAIINVMGKQLPFQKAVEYEAPLLVATDKSVSEKYKTELVPAVFLVGKSGRIEFQYVNPNYKVRLQPEVLLAARSIFSLWLRTISLSQARMLE